MTMPNRHVWYELMSEDHDATERFYTDVVGWNTTDSGRPGVRYTIIFAGDHPIGGIVTLPDRPAFWTGYIGVDDVDSVARKATEMGGTVHREPEDIPGVGRFAILADPHGAAFVLLKGKGMPDRQPLPYMTPGTVGWHELHSQDWEAAFEFYSGLFGWEKDEAMDMGPMGTYQLFRTGGDPVGAMFNDPDIGQSRWLYYFSVRSIDVATAKINAGGGELVAGPMEVPGGMWIVRAQDPEGVMFALVGPKG